MKCNYTCDPSGWPQEPEAYGDISGIGVVIGFVSTAWLTVFILILYYLFAFDPELDPYRPEDDPGLKAKRPNPVDQEIKRWIRAVTPRLWTPDGDELREKLRKALVQCVLIFADTQIITGITILVSGFLSLNQCLSMFHWQMVVLLANFSTVTHLAALTFLRTHFHNNRTQRTIRLISMGILLAFVIASMTPLGHADSASLGAFAKCFFHGEWDTGTSSYSAYIIGLLLLIYSSILRAAKLFSVTSNVYVAWLRLKIRGMSHALLARTSRRYPPEESGSNVVRNIAPLALYVFGRFYFDLYTSMAAEVYSLLVVTIWTTIRLAVAMKDQPEDESTWAFGQIIPVALLVSPILATSDSFFILAIAIKHTRWTRENSAERSSQSVRRLWNSFKQKMSSGELGLIDRNLDPEERRNLIRQTLSPSQEGGPRPPWFPYLVILAVVVPVWATISTFRVNLQYNAQVKDHIPFVSIIVLAFQPLNLYTFISATYIAAVFGVNIDFVIFLATLFVGISVVVVNSWIDNLIMLAMVLPTSVFILFSTYAGVVILAWRKGQQASRVEDASRTIDEVTELNAMSREGENLDRDTGSTRAEPEVQDRRLTV